MYHNKIGCVFWRLRITSVSEFISDYTPNLVEALIRQIAFIPKHEAEAATPAQTVTMMIHSDTQHYTTYVYIRYDLKTFRPPTPNRPEMWSAYVNAFE